MGWQLSILTRFARVRSKLGLWLQHFNLRKQKSEVFFLCKPAGEGGACAVSDHATWFFWKGTEWRTGRFTNTSTGSLPVFPLLVTFSRSKITMYIGKYFMQIEYKRNTTFKLFIIQRKEKWKLIANEAANSTWKIFFKYFKFPWWQRQMCFVLFCFLFNLPTF